MRKLYLFIGIFLVSASIFLATTVLAYRMSRPPTFSYPMDKEQINQLNASLEDIFNLTNGKFNLDIVTESKLGAKNGDIWIFNDSGTYRLQYKAGDIIRTLTP